MLFCTWKAEVPPVKETENNKREMGKMLETGSFDKNFAKNHNFEEDRLFYYQHCFDKYKWQEWKY